MTSWSDWGGPWLLYYRLGIRARPYLAEEVREALEERTRPFSVHLALGWSAVSTIEQRLELPVPSTSSEAVKYRRQVVRSMVER